MVPRDEPHKLGGLDGLLAEDVADKCRPFLKGDLLNRLDHCFWAFALAQPVHPCRHLRMECPV